jgi:hypothetical protein
MRKVTFARNVHFTGRNGYFKQSGVEISEDRWNDAITVTPLTSKGVPANCFISIPKEYIEDFTRELLLMPHKLTESR